MSGTRKRADAARDTEIVRVYLETHMIPDPEAAARYGAPNFELTFTGGRKFDTPTGATGFNARRYKWVKKKMERFETVPGEDETIVYSLGTLYGEWSDGTPFEGNRYIDRFVVRDGLIVSQDVWNDSAERLLIKNGLDV